MNGFIIITYYIYRQQRDSIQQQYKNIIAVILPLYELYIQLRNSKECFHLNLFHLLDWFDKFFEDQTFSFLKCPLTEQIIFTLKANKYIW